MARSKTAPKGNKHPQTFLSKLIYSRGAKIFLLWLAPFLVLESFFFSEVLKGHNYIEIFPEEYLFPTLMHLVTALIIALLIYWLGKGLSVSGKLVASTLLGFLFVNYDGRLSSLLELLRAVIPILPKREEDIPMISIVFMLLLFLVSIWAGKRFELLQARHRSLNTPNVLLSIFILVGFIFTGQTLRVAETMRQVNAENKARPASLPKSEDATSATGNGKPDIYYIVLDRYTNSEVLKDQFSYDNSQFISFLQQNNFKVNENAYSNYPYTSISVSSTLNGNYTKEQVAPYKNNDVQSRTLYHNLIKRASVTKALKDNGYTYHHIGASYGATNDAPQADFDHIGENTLKLPFGQEKRLNGVEASQFKQSPFYRFARDNSLWWPVELKELDNEEYVRTQLDTLDKIAGEKQSSGKFVFAHILVPHEPFIFNSDGSISEYGGDDNNGKPIKKKFTDQTTFINGQIENTVRTILKNSKGQAVIILNADEGPYPNILNDTFRTPVDYDEVLGDGVVEGDMRQWSDDWLRMKYGIQQAVHIPKASNEDLSHLSSVNVFRIVLNSYFGYKLDYLPNCQFGFTIGSQDEYKYADITSRFTNNPDMSCKNYESL